jgi:hypothetical protein
MEKIISSVCLSVLFCLMPGKFLVISRLDSYFPVTVQQYETFNETDRYLLRSLCEKNSYFAVKLFIRWEKKITSQKRHLYKILTKQR